MKACGGAPSKLTPEPPILQGSPTHQILTELVQKLDEIRKPKKLWHDIYKPQKVATVTYEILAQALDKLTVFPGALMTSAKEATSQPSQEGPPLTPSLPSPNKTPEHPPPYVHQEAPLPLEKTPLYPTLPSAPPDAQAHTPPPTVTSSEALPVSISRIKVDGQGNATQVTKFRPRSKAEMKEFISDTARGANEPPLLWLGRLALEHGQELVDREEGIILARTSSWSRGLSGSPVISNTTWPLTAPALAFLHLQQSLQGIQVPKGSVKDLSSLRCAIAGGSIMLWSPAQYPLGLTQASTRPGLSFMSSQESPAMIATPSRENPLAAWLKAYTLQEVLIGNLSDVPASHDCVACTRREASEEGSPFLWKFLSLSNLTPHLTLQQIRELSLGLEALANITSEGLRRTSDALTVLANYAEQNRLLLQTILQKDFCVALEDLDPSFKGQCCLCLQPGWKNISAVANQLSPFAVQIRKEREQRDWWQAQWSSRGLGSWAQSIKQWLITVAIVLVAFLLGIAVVKQLIHRVVSALPLQARYSSISLDSSEPSPLDYSDSEDL
ncbi:uncharacterized protein LOC123377554 [Mauremys mutica]|uniref:uncharacterized protein LOC123377554 n=1 Tax=Mauremys mutica TaxID=74926 RepID=UPI001D167CED|nr:uncharacterized protein LOC123377554 [Mauremys mutica]